MAQWVDGFRRTTRNYASEWAELDETKEVGPLRVLSQRFRAADGQQQGYGVVGDCWMRVKVPASLLPSETVAVLRDTFTSGCRCEHDCCGHVQRLARAFKQVRKREWLVRVDLRANI